jgi:outer membrane receptor for ferrienterochelin and colicin
MLKVKFRIQNFMIQIKIFRFILILSLLFNLQTFAQKNGVIIGTVKDLNTKESLPGVAVSIEGTSFNAVTDVNGSFKFTIPVGTYNISSSYIGYQPLSKYNIVVTTGNAQIVNFELMESAVSLSTVVVEFNKNKTAIAADMVTPLSVQQLTTEEIKSSPGGNFDVSKVVQTLPGVGVSNGTGDRNDIIIRGGAPNENVYYLDGIEIPVLNHFQTQGSSGGAQGILNVSFIESLKLTSSAFDARYDNALASTFVITQRDGNPERLSGNARISATESVVTLEGPVSENTTFLVSGRKSYLGLLFKLIDLPIRPNFYDFQYKVSHKFNDKWSLTAIGLGAIDNFKFAATKESSLENTYILRSSPYINQWNYTAGFNLNQKINNGYINYIISRNVFENNIDKYEDENAIESQKTSAINSQEIENKFRWDINKFVNSWKLSAGVSIQNVGYFGNVFVKTSPTDDINFNSDINFWKYGAFAQASKNIFNQRLLVSGGLRTDLNSFTANGDNPFKTLSPRLSLAYHINSQLDLTASVGTYYKIPTYTALGYQDQNNVFVNKNMDYIRSTHYVLGTQYLPKNSLRFTLEGFFKQYSNYPVSARTGASLANLGSDYGSIGSETILSVGNGETYGVEIYAQQKLVNKLFYVVSYSYIRSKFSGLDKTLLPSSWDTKNLVSATLGYKLKNQWDLGLKYRYAGGAPYTPFDMQLSQQNYVIQGTGTLDYSRLNSERLRHFSQLDLRIDKRINFKKTTLNFYVDLQNVLKQEDQNNPKYTFKRTDDNSSFETTDGLPLKVDGSNGIPYILNTTSGNLIPNIGLSFEF